MEKRIALKDIITENGAIIPKGTVVDCEVKSCVYGDNQKGFTATIFRGDEELCSIVLKSEDILAKVYFVGKQSVPEYRMLFRQLYHDFRHFLQCRVLHIRIDNEGVEFEMR